MAEAAYYLPLLLAPVVALLFLNLRLSRRLRFPHDLLVAESRRGIASFLPRWLRTYYDLLFDAAIACALAFALAPPAAGNAAAAIDCSRSMLAGAIGARPLDIAVERLRSDPALLSARPFALAFDGAARSSRLVPIDWLRREASAESAARRLETELEFFAVDPSGLGELRKRGYGELTYLTDDLGGRAEGFSSIESGFAVGYAAWPAAARPDPSSGTWMVVLAETFPRGPATVQAWDRGAGSFVPLAQKRYAIEERAGGRTFFFAEPGLYRLTLRAPPGDLDADLAVLLRPTARPAAASGPFSERMLEVFDHLEPSASPSVVLEDLAPAGPAAGARAAARAGAVRILTSVQGADGELVIDPALTGGRPVAAGLSPAARLAIGPSSLANDDLVLAYSALLRASELPAFLTSPPEGPGALRSVGAFYLASSGRDLVPLIAPAQESFAPEGDRAIRLPGRRSPRALWALLLAALAAAKLAVWSRLSGKDLFRERSVP